MGKKKTKVKANKPVATVPEPSFQSDMDLITAAISSANQTIFMKVCRLCESKDGPFLNIFDADKITAKKIDELMPFKIAENDDLPHKICFRCSAKVEELHEFIQKCTHTQQRLSTALGKKEPQAVKSKTRAIWEEKLNKNNISNDDICDALIKKAMEGIKDIPLNPVRHEEEKSSSPGPLKKDLKPKADSIQPLKKEAKSTLVNKTEFDDDNDNTLENCDRKFIPTRTSRSQNPECLLDGLPDVKRYKKVNKQKSHEATDINKKKAVKKTSSEEEGSSEIDIEPPVKEKEKAEELKPIEPPKPFNIMDHVSIIKVNGVGVLFQCKLCNRNFLKKDVVMTHGCAKNGGIPKVDFTKNIVAPEPPKPSVVKYINTKIDGELGKPIEDKTVNEKPEDEVNKSIPGNKPKPKIGPASRTKRQEKNPMIGMKIAPINEQPVVKTTTPPPPQQPVTPPAVPASSVQFPNIPSLNSRYKLVPGPNNTFQLVEEPLIIDTPETSKPNDDNGCSKSSKKRKSDESIKSSQSKNRKSNSKIDSEDSKTHRSKTTIDEVIDLDDSPPETKKSESKSNDQPYPVGLFSTLPHHSSVYPPPVEPEPTFTTPAMKKQSYTIVQTGNPSKLLISTKPQPPVEEPSKKKQKKSSKHDSKKETVENKQSEPFNVTLEDAAPLNKDPFFTFINVDPLLQPSYVLPTDNIIQESQISTSTPASKGNTDSKDSKYSCNMCNETFSREKKLLAHIHSHYNTMDEEDRLREKNSRKKGKK